MFRYIEIYSEYFRKEDFCEILDFMNYNNQYYNDPYNKISYRLKYLETQFKERFNSALIKSDVEKYLYGELYKVESRLEYEKCEEFLDIVGKRALLYSIWNLWHFILKLIRF